MRLIVLLSLLLFIGSCAQIVTLEGGKKDIYAPAIDSSKTHPLNGVLNFNEQEINLHFKEYIKLNKASENIIITPQLKETPDYLVKNKNFKLTFKEQLEENTTYVINFNGAIQDITEANDSIFQYVFSTGSYIDSLYVSGKVTDSYTNKPIDKCLIAIYPATKSIEYDSIPYLIKPTYIGQTNKDGDYKIDYLKQGEYVVFAFTDVNRNMLFNSSNEKIGFLSQKTILINENKNAIDFKLFNIPPAKTLIKSTTLNYPGKLELVFNKKPDYYSLKANQIITQQETDREDSLIYWLKSTPTTTVEFYSVINEGNIDTIRPIMKDKPKDDKPTPLKLTTNDKSGKLLPNQNFILSINEPIEVVNKTKIHFYNADSVEVEITNKTDNLTNLIFITADSNITHYKIDSAAIQSTFGNTNDKGKKGNLTQLVAEDYYGKLILTIDSLEGQHIFELLDDKNTVVETVINESEKTITFKDLAPGKYHLRMVKDINKDGIWTSGSIKNEQQPESVFYYTDEIKIRSKWDLDIEWIIIE